MNWGSNGHQASRGARGGGFGRDLGIGGVEQGRAVAAQPGVVTRTVSFPPGEVPADEHGSSPNAEFIGKVKVLLIGRDG